MFFDIYFQIVVNLTLKVLKLTLKDSKR